MRAVIPGTLLEGASRSAEPKGSIVVEGFSGARQALRSAPRTRRSLFPSKGVRYGKESYRLPEIAGAGGGRKSLAADWARARSARPQHHGVLQGIQRADPEDGKGHADPGGHHHLPGPLLHLGDEDPAGLLLPQEGGEARIRLQDAGPRQGRQGDQGAGQGNRRAEDEGPELRHGRRGHAHDRGLRPVHGYRGRGVIAMAQGKRSLKAREGIDREKLYALDDAVKMVKERAKAKFDETIEIAMNLGVDPRHADQMVRGVVNLPNGTGRSQRVAVFARGAKADEARAAGARRLRPPGLGGAGEPRPSQFQPADGPPHPVAPAR